MAAKSKLTTTIAAVVEAAGTMRRVYREGRCPCGCGGTWDKTVGGTIGGKPAVWMGCARRGGSAVGGGLTGDAYHTARAVIAACERLGVSVQDAVESEATWPTGEGRVVTGPLALDYERETLARVVEGWTGGGLSRIDPERHLSRRRYTLDRLDIDAADVCDGIWTRPAGV